MSCAVIVPKDDGSLRLTLDARNLNKALFSTNCPIPKEEDIKAQLSGSKIFSKLDFKSVFWQLELHPDSGYRIIFHANNDLRCKDDLIIATKTTSEHKDTLLKVMEPIQNANLTLNPEKCIFGKSAIKF